MVYPMIGVANPWVHMRSGWHHTVENLEDTLSINHNWLNGHNIAWGWGLLQRERAAAAAAIDDCRCGAPACADCACTA